MPKKFEDLPSRPRQYLSNIDSKLDAKTFYWSMGVVAAVLGGIFWLIMSRCDPLNDKISSLSNRLTRLETIVDVKLKK